MNRIKDMRALLLNYMKVIGSMKGVRTEWTFVMQSWRQLWNSEDVLSKRPGVIAYILKREALELVNFGKFDTLSEIVCLDKSAWGLKDAISKVSYYHALMGAQLCLLIYLFNRFAHSAGPSRGAMAK